MHTGDKGVKLMVDGWTLRGTGTPEYREAGLETLERLKRNHPNQLWEFREYMVAIHGVENDVCTNWTEEGGWSIWYR